MNSDQEIFTMKISRILSILNILIEKEKITAQELADKLEVSKRTIYRDIDILNQAGIPIISYPGSGGGLGVMDGHKLDKSILSTDDFKNILAGLKALKSISSNNKINYLIEKLIPQKKHLIEAESDIIIDLSSWFSDNRLQETIDELRMAIVNRKCINIAYHAKGIFSSRTVEPYKLVFKSNHWYLFAFCMERQNFRLFQINRISSYQVLEDEFSLKPINNDMLNFNFENDYFQASDESPLEEVILKYESYNESFLMDRIGAQNFQFEDGTGKIVFHTSNMNWMADFIMSLQDKVIIIKPLTLQNEIMDRINRMNNIYKR